MISNESIIWFGGSDWWAHHKRNEQFSCELFATKNKVLFINSLGLGFPNPLKTGVMSRIMRKAKSMMKWLVKTETNVYVGSPFFIPLWSIPAVRKLNQWILKAQIRLMIRKAGISDPIVVSTLPTSNEVLDAISYKAHIYNIKDNFSAYHEKQFFMSVVDNDYELRETADVVICPSKGIYNEIAPNRDHVFWIPHGVHPTFLNAPLNLPEPLEIANISHPRISYWGHLDSKLDEELIHTIAARRPDWQFIFFGTKTTSYPAIEQMPNVHFWGYAPPEYLIGVGAHSDVLIMPWKDSQWVRSQCPIKYREYLALGKPVVSSPSDEVELAYPGEAIIALTPEEWIDGIERSLREDTIEKAMHRRSLVKGYDMDAADRQFNDAIEFALTLKRKTD